LCRAGPGHAHVADCELRIRCLHLRDLGRPAERRSARHPRSRHDAVDGRAGASVRGSPDLTGFLTVPLFNRLIEAHPACIRCCTALLVGGDALSVAHIRKALEVLPVGLLNGYGPTENTTFSCVHAIRSLPPGSPSVPIGRPIANS